MWYGFAFSGKRRISSYLGVLETEAPNTLVYVAAVSAGNNFEVGNMIAETMNKAG